MAEDVHHAGSEGLMNSALSLVKKNRDSTPYDRFENACPLAKLLDIGRHDRVRSGSLYCHNARRGVDRCIKVSSYLRS